MAELDNLLGSRISLISQVDVRYDGILFSINAKESSIVLKDVRCLGTEERVADASKKVPPSQGVLAFVAFPGTDIKDLYLHDIDSTAPEPVPEPPKKPAAATRPAKSAPENASAAPPPAPAPTKTNTAKTDRSKQQSRQPEKKPATQQEAAPQAKAAPTKAVPAKAGPSRSEKGSGIGTGEHLLHLRVKKSGSDQNKDANTTAGVFDFEAALSAFNKTEVMQSVAVEKEADASKALYNKDDFFDSLSCDVLDREMGRRTHMTNSEERSLNQNTFGAVAVQSSYRGRRYNGGGRGRGSSGSHNQGGRGRGGGRGSYSGRGSHRGRGGRSGAGNSSTNN